MYYVSYLLDMCIIYYGSYCIMYYERIEDREIYIIDGQNQIQIEQYKTLNNTNSWNPCIPMTFKGINNNYFGSTIKITVTFSSDTSWRDWYPLHVCDFPNNTDQYKNMYLFQSEEGLYLNNLKIDGYTIHNATNYPIMSTNYKRSSGITNGLFRNVSCTTSDPLFFGKDVEFPQKGSYEMSIINNSFVDITTLGIIFYGQHDKYSMFSTNFRNVSVHAIVSPIGDQSFDQSNSDFVSKDLTITDCNFTSINSIDALFLWFIPIMSTITIQNNVFEHISGKAIFQSSSTQVLSLDVSNVK